MLDRLKLLEKNVVDLRALRQKVTINDFRSDRHLEWALRYGLFESIQIVIDISCHLVSKYNLGNPQSYAECVELLQQHKYLSEEVSSRLLGMIGLRNILVHDYVEVDVSRLYELLSNDDDFTQFVQSVSKYV